MTRQELYSRYLKEYRIARNLTQNDFSKMAGLNEGVYSHIERGKFVYFNDNVRVFLYMDELTDSERKKLQDIIENEELDSMKESNKYRIKNIPGFYRDLNALGNIQDLDKNDPKLQALRIKLGVNPIMTSKVSADYQ